MGEDNPYLRVLGGQKTDLSHPEEGLSNTLDFKDMESFHNFFNINKANALYNHGVSRKVKLYGDLDAIYHLIPNSEFPITKAKALPFKSIVDSDIRDLIDFTFPHLLNNYRNLCPRMGSSVNQNAVKLLTVNVVVSLITASSVTQCSSCTGKA